MPSGGPCDDVPDMQVNKGPDYFHYFKLMRKRWQTTWPQSKESRTWAITSGPYVHTQQLMVRQMPIRVTAAFAASHVTAFPVQGLLPMPLRD